MPMKRLCEVKEELRLPVVESGDTETVRSWAGLQCPHAGKCDQSRPRCDGLTPANLLSISRIEDAIFTKGWVHVDNEQPMEMGVSWKRTRRKGDY
jgi:hypothetical protein